MSAESLAQVDSLIAAQGGIPFMDSTTLFPGIRERIPLLHQGKVRDNYHLNDEQVLMVATDHISAFDVVMSEGIIGKGIYLTQMTLMWYGVFPYVPNHLITSNVDDFPPPFRGVDELRGRSMLVRRLNMVPVECVVRGYISGSLWSDYRRGHRTILGNRYPYSLIESDKLPKPVFTPATKADKGEHDINITFSNMVRRVGRPLSETLRTLSLDIYQRGVDYSQARGIILADTKFEFGTLNGIVYLADETLTPDSSRFWPADQYKPGGPQPSFDKQYVRDYLDSTGWHHEPPPPPLPEREIIRTAEKYLEAYRRLTS